MTALVRSAEVALDGPVQLAHMPDHPVDALKGVFGSGDRTGLDADEMAE